MSTESRRPSTRCLVVLPKTAAAARVSRVIGNSIAQAQGELVQGGDSPDGPTQQLDSLVSLIAVCDLVIADVSERDSRVLLTIGMARALGKPQIVLSKNGASIPTDLQSFPSLEYDTTDRGLYGLGLRLRGMIREFIRSPPVLLHRGATSHIPIDWDMLEPRETDNLCRELLAQMGFLKVAWSDIAPEVDMIAELPKRDPDGFEYRELWMISIDNRKAQRLLFDFAERDPEFLIHRLLRRSDMRPPSSAPVTLLLMMVSGRGEGERLESFRARLTTDSYLQIKSPFAGGVRFRVWDRPYIASIVRQHPQLAYKYFSEEGRAQSKFRKSPEQLYRENVNANEQLARVVRDYQEEKSKRITAERDAIWKDISFSAAHKIGNPLFALETDLKPLEKRVAEKRTTEALEVVANMRSAVEKAKAIIDQFKSLTRAQEIQPTSTPLEPILLDSCKTARQNGVACDVECAPSLRVYGDPERLSECFDELIANATHWFDKPKRTIRIVAAVAPASPDGVTQGGTHALIHVKDNGVGVPLENKRRIFDAFFTTQDHGTGLGLALVRRIVEGHGGTVAEVGTPGKGADFEIYLPINPAEAQATRRPRRRKLAAPKTPTTPRKRKKSEDS